MYIPVGTVVHIELISNNVIHSFWVPQLAGKTDVIPGRDNKMWLKADQDRHFRGLCTEFCGQQHAHMDFQVVVERRRGIPDMGNRQQQAPSDGRRRRCRGKKVFARGCVACHLINGQAGERADWPQPDALRQPHLIAGGCSTNTPENLTAWIHDAQAVQTRQRYACVYDDSLTINLMRLSRIWKVCNRLATATFAWKEYIMATGSVVTPGRISRPAWTNGIGSWLTTIDHKQIGMMYMYTAFAYFLIGGWRRCSSARSCRRRISRCSILSSTTRSSPCMARR